MSVEELARRVREAAYLEGDFLLRSGRRSTFYLDKYRFETQPDLLRDLGAALAERIRAVEPDAVRIAGPGARRRGARGRRPAWPRACRS